MTRDGARALLHRIDAWGIAFILAALALLVHDALAGPTILLLVAVTLMYWFGYVVNDYWDAPFDAGDEAKARTNFFIRHPATKKQALFALVTVSAFLLFAFAHFDYPGLAALALYLFIMWSYSAPPLRFKSRPGLDLLVHALFAQSYPYALCLVLFGAVWTPLDYTIIALTFLASLAGQLEQQIRDFAIDARTDTTFATRVGLATTKNFLKLITLLLILLALAGLANGALPPFLIPYGLLALPLTAHRLTIDHRQRRPSKLAYLTVVAALLYTGALFIYSLLL